MTSAEMSRVRARLGEGSGSLPIGPTSWFSETLFSTSISGVQWSA